MNPRSLLAFLLVATALLFAALPAAAQAPQSSINLNAYECPAGYDPVSDCTKLDGVVVAVTQDGQPHGEVTSSAVEGAELNVMFGAAITLSVVGGQPAGTVLEDTSLSFDAVEGMNAVTLVFVSREEPAPATDSYLTAVAWSCPADYAQLADACTRLADVYIDVARDGQPFAQIRTLSTEAATLDIPTGAAIELEIAGGVPERSVLESEQDLSFTAVEGENSVMLVFVAQEEETPPPPHSDTNALVVEALVCPVAYVGNNYVRDCPGEDDIEVTVSRDADGFTVTEPTGTDGIVGFQGLGEGTYTVELGVPGDFADFLTVCGTPEAFEPREITNPDTNRIGVYVGPEEEVTCTFFIVPVDAKGDPDPTKTPPAVPTVTPSGAPITGLPSTGSGEATDDGRSFDRFLLIAGTGILIASASTLLMRQRRA
jgi:hypothetical protein